MIAIEYNTSKLVKDYSTSFIELRITLSDENRDLIYQILSIFLKRDILFEGMGLTSNLKEILENISETNYCFIDNEKKGIFRWQEESKLIFKVNNEEDLKTILELWVSICYEKRSLYFCFSDYTELLFEKLKSDKLQLDKVSCECIECYVKNDLESNSHNTFVLILKKDNLYQVQEIITNYLLKIY